MPGRSWYCRRPALAAQLSAGPSRARCVSVQTHRYSKAPKVLPSHKAGVLTDSFANLIDLLPFVLGLSFLLQTHFIPQTPCPAVQGYPHVPEDAMLRLAISGPLRVLSPLPGVPFF